MTESKYLDPGQEIFKVTKKAEKVLFVDNLIITIRMRD